MLDQPSPLHHGRSMKKILLPLVLVLFASCRSVEPNHRYIPAGEALSKEIGELRKAANQGDALAQWFLGSMYEWGTGVPKDYVAAYAWYSLAAYNGAESGAKNRDLLAKEMTPEQIAKSQELSKELLKKIEANKAK